MICPFCEHDNLPGLDECRNCLMDLTHLDRPVAQDRVERSLMDDPVSVLRPWWPVIVAPTATVGEVIAAMIQLDTGAALVVDAAGGLAGVFSERDLLVKVAGYHPDYADRPVVDFMTRRPETIRETDSLAFALHKMDCGDYRHLPVLQDGRLVGMISVRDMLAHITQICESSGA